MFVEEVCQQLGENDKNAVHVRRYAWLALSNKLPTEMRASSVCMEVDKSPTQQDLAKLDRVWTIYKETKALPADQIIGNITCEVPLADAYKSINTYATSDQIINSTVVPPQQRKKTRKKFQEQAANHQQR